MVDNVKMLESMKDKRLIIAHLIQYDELNKSVITKQGSRWRQRRYT